MSFFFTFSVELPVPDCFWLVQGVSAAGSESIHGIEMGCSTPVLTTTARGFAHRQIAVGSQVADVVAAASLKQNNTFSWQLVNEFSSLFSLSFHTSIM